LAIDLSRALVEWAHILVFDQHIINDDEQDRTEHLFTNQRHLIDGMKQPVAVK
jgi:hypothetical protein